LGELVAPNTLVSKKQISCRELNSTLPIFKLYIVPSR